MVEVVFWKLGEFLLLGYCNVGEVIVVGVGVVEFQVGDWVVSNGYYVEVVSVFKNLVVKILDGVSYEEVSFIVIGVIVLQGIWLVQLIFGEIVVVMGLGLIGFIVV